MPRERIVRAAFAFWAVPESFALVSGEHSIRFTATGCGPNFVAEAVPGLVPPRGRLKDQKRRARIFAFARGVLMQVNKNKNVSRY